MSRIASLTAAMATAAVLLFPLGLNAQTSASQNLTVEAEVIKALALTKVTAGNLDFGLVAQGTNETIAADGGSAIKFQANGQASTNVNVTFSGVTLNGPSGATMAFTPAVNGNSSDAQGSSSALSTGATVALDGTTGDYYFWVGGSVTAGATQTTGSYTGTFTLTVAYTGI